MTQRVDQGFPPVSTEGHEHHGGEHGSRQTGRALVPLLRAYILICKQEAGVRAEKANWEWHGLLKLQIPLSGTQVLQQGYNALMFPNEFFQLETKYSNI